MKKPFKERLGDFMEGKGFYIVLFLCVAAIGISGYYLFSSMNMMSRPSQPVSAPVQVTVTPTPEATAEHPLSVTTPTPQQAVKPETTPAASTPQAAAAAATPSPEPAPDPTPAPTPSPVVTSSVFTWPVRGEILADFSVEVLAYDETMGDWRTHAGLDIAAVPGTQVKAAAGGTVVDIVQDVLMGTTVYLDHGNGITSSYANLAAVPTVEVGDIVSTGDIIGSVGQTAIAESGRADHLHFAMAEGGSPVNPLEYLPEA